MKANRWIGAALAMAVALPAVAENGRDDPNESWLPPSIRWDQAEQVIVELADNRFEPEQLAFDAGRPYKLVLRNVGKRAHDLVDLDFFHSIVLKAVVSSTGSVFTPHVHSVSVQPGQETTIYFVGVRPGDFDMFCSLPGHREDGMEGRLRIRAAGERR